MKYTLIGLGVLLLAGIGAYALFGRPQPVTPPEMQKEMMEDVHSDPENVMMEKSDDEMMDKDAAMMNGDDAMSFQGAILAGTQTPYIEFNQADYEKALAEGKIIYLEFYASWCPTCRSQEKDLFEGIEMLHSDQIVAFRVNFKDDDTDEFEKELAKEFNIPYQHTKVILVDGQVVFNSTETWDADDLVDSLEELL